MSTTITINGQTYKGLDEFYVTGDTPPVKVGIYYALPPLGLPPEAGEPQYDETEVRIPGVAGTVIVRSEFMRLPIYVDLVIVSALSNLGATKKTLLAALKQLARYTVALPDGDSYDGCKLRVVGKPTRVNLDGYVANIYTMVFEQLSPTN